MKISKLFHYLYAALCFLPLLVIPAFMLAVRSDNNYQPITISTSGYEIRNKYETNNINTLDDLQINKVYHLDEFNVYGDDSSYQIDLCLLSFDEISFNYDADLIELNDYVFESYNSNDDNYIYTFFVFSDLSQDFYFNCSNSNAYIQGWFQYEAPIWDVMFTIYDVDFYIPNNYSLTYFKAYYESLIENYDESLPSSSDFQSLEYVYSEGIVYNDTDIGSQLLYTCYVTTDKYMNFDEVLNLGAISDWIEINVFNNNVPLIWTIIWHYLDYWLLLSIFWLCFDVLIYVPQLAHRWLDKASLE